LIGGSFSEVDDVPEACLARLKPDGTLDVDFNHSLAPTEDFGVESIVVQADGSILIGGDFDTVQGLDRPGFARLKADVLAAA
jgi:hypothetical protein